MEINMYLLIAFLFSLLIIAYLVLKLRRGRDQLGLIKDALTDIKA